MRAALIAPSAHNMFRSDREIGVRTQRDNGAQEMVTIRFKNYVALKTVIATIPVFKIVLLEVCVKCAYAACCVGHFKKIMGAT